MKFTDIFIRRPVLALVVNLVIIIAGLQAIRALNVRQYPRSENSVGHGHDRLRRGERRTDPRVHHHAARARHRGGRRHRLHPVAERPGALDHQRPPEAQLRPHQGARGNQRQGRPGPPRSAAGRRGAGHQRGVGRQPVRLGLSQLQVRHSPAESDHRLPGAHRPAAAFRRRRRAARGHPRRPHLRHAHLAQARAHGRAQHQPGPGAPGAGRQQLPRRRRPHQGLARPGQPDRQHRPALGG